MPKRPLDQRSLRPFNYTTDRFSFGQRLHIEWQLPPGGDVRSLQVARAQHLLSCAIDACGDRHTTRHLTGRFKFSKQYWSDCKRGAAWMPATLLAAGITFLLEEYERRR